MGICGSTFSVQKMNLGHQQTKKMEKYPLFSKRTTFKDKYLKGDTSTDYADQGIDEITGQNGLSNQISVENNYAFNGFSPNKGALARIQHNKTTSTTEDVISYTDIGRKSFIQGQVPGQTPKRQSVGHQCGRRSNARGSALIERKKGSRRIS